ncbi:TonB-dependent receptor [Bdellovibrionota bacterium FG-2]
MRRPRFFHIRRAICTLLAVLALTGYGAGAQDAGDDLKNLSEMPLEELIKLQVITVATGSHKSIPEAPAIASVITAQDIEAMGATTVEEALEMVPGLHVSNSGELYSPKYLIRGISTRYNPETLVLINGIPITSIFRGDRANRLGTLPVKMVSRIEVIRGPGSALYGADALSGVINVVTKTASDSPENQKTEMGGNIGSFNTHEAWLMHSEKYGELKGIIMADYRNTNGQNREITQDAQTQLDNLTGTRASLAPGPVNLSAKELALFLDLEKTKWRLRGSYHGLSNAGTGQGVSSALDPNGRASFARSTVDLTYHEPKLNENWDFTSQLAYYHGSQEVDKNLILFPPGSNLGSGVFPEGAIGNPEFWERHILFDNSAIYKGFEDHRIRLGTGYQFLHLYRVKGSTNFFPSTFSPRPGLTDVADTSEIYIPENSRNSFYGYAQNEWKLSRDWELTAGLRYDHYSDFGSTLNPRAALVWKTTPALTTKFLYGRAFRAPGFIELYIINNPVSLGNPNLKPETNNVYELAWAYQLTPNWHASLNLFHYKARDMITFLKDPSGTATAQNDGSQIGNGFEFETKIKATPNLHLTGNYSFLKATNEAADEPAGNYPKHQAYLRDDWTFMPNWTWGNQFNWVGPQNREPGDSREPLKSYATVDVILRRKALFDKLNLATAVRNLFDSDVREPSAAIPNDLPQAGRSIYVEFSYHLF